MERSGPEPLSGGALPGQRPVRSAAPYVPDLPPPLAFAVTFAGLLPLALLLSHLDALVLPVWVFLLAGSLLGTSAQSRVQGWLAGGDGDGRLWLRAANAVGLFGLAVACTGATFLLPLAAIVVGASHIDSSGGRAWRPVAGCAGVALLALEALVHVGLLDSPLTPAASHGAALVSALVAVLALLTLARTEDDRRALMCEVRSAEAWFRALVQDSHEVLATVCPDGTLSYLSPSAAAWGVDPEALRGTHLRDLLHPEDVAEADARFAQCLGTGGEEPVQAEVRLRVSTGEQRWMAATMSNQSANPAIGAVVVHLHDVTERREHQQRLAHAAEHDALTGLSNRRAFTAHLQEALLRAQGPEVGVVFCDLDGFKAVNDTLGHAAGDELLVAVAQRLLSCVREHDVVARLGGDEFVVLVPAGATPAVLERMTSRIREALLPAFDVGGQRVGVGTSAGTALGGPGTTADELTRTADERMYAAKRAARGGARGLVDPGPRDDDERRPARATERTAPPDPPLPADFPTSEESHRHAGTTTQRLLPVDQPS